MKNILGDRSAEVDLSGIWPRLVLTFEVALDPQVSHAEAKDW